MTASHTTTLSPVTAALDASELLEEMLRIPSVSGHESALSAFLAERLAEAGFDTSIDPAGNLVASWGRGDEVAGLVGHLDTVPGEIPVRRIGDRLYGRGAVDAKGPLTAALAAVARQPRDAGRRFTVIGAVEEETSSSGARFLAATRVGPPHLVILEPSGADGITIAYKGSVRLRWSRVQDAGHGAGPASSAADAAFAFVRALQNHAIAWSGDASLFDRLDVRVLACEARSDGLQDRADVEVALRVPLAYAMESLLRDVQSLAGAGDLRVLSQEPPVRTDRNSHLARSFVQAIREHGGSPRFKLKTGTSDLNILAPAWNCPAVAYGPGRSLLDHTPDEHIEIADLERAVDVLDGVLHRL